VCSDSTGEEARDEDVDEEILRDRMRGVVALGPSL
jgi:hypothetical protein